MVVYEKASEGNLQEPKETWSVFTLFPESLLFQSKRYLLHDVWPVLCVESSNNRPYHSFDCHFDG